MAAPASSRLALRAINFLTDNELDPATVDLLTLQGIVADGSLPYFGWFAEEEKIKIVVRIVGVYVSTDDRGFTRRLAALWREQMAEVQSYRWIGSWWGIH